MKITPLLTGTHAMKEMSAGVDIYDHTSAVTLLQNEGKNMLVDTGSRGKFQLLKDKLAGLGLTPADIDFVILTHFHLDHAYNTAFFPDARVIGWMHEWKPGATFRFADIEKMEFIGGVKIIRTPGHAEEHLSVVATDNSGKKVVLAGDAINKQFAETGEIHALCYDRDLYRQSAEKILKIADVIIPGHGEIFESVSHSQ
jgi:glyoxylase-like metal-dependent hydrolase (beta-lactamase superfamily II)